MKWPKLAQRAAVGAAVGLVVFLLALLLHRGGWLEVAELKSLDDRFRRYADPAQAHPDFVLVAVDEASLEAFGRWPWPRDRHGYVVRYLKEAGARAVIFDVLFTEPDENDAQFDDVFAEEVRAAGNVFLPVLFQNEAPEGAAEPAVNAAIPVDGDRESRYRLYASSAVKLPIQRLAESARGLGFINLTPDKDGTTRHIPLVGQAGSLVVPQLSLAAARYLLGADAVRLEASGLRVGPVTAPLTEQGTLLIDWHGTLEARTYPAYSVGAVLRSFVQREQGEPPLLSPERFKDKIVFVAATAAGTYELRVTPLSPYTPGVLVHMAALDNLLQGRFMKPAPAWAFVAATLALCLGTAWSFMLLPFQVLKLGAAAVLAWAYHALTVHAFTEHRVWMEMVGPLGALVFTFGAVATVEFLTEGRQRRQLRAVFDRYMAPDVVEEIMRNPAEIKLGGEKRELTVSFSDVAGFTTIAERLPPEELVGLLNDYLSAMTDIILKHRGNVNKYLGDGIMAIFGAPRGEPNHATLACLAALESQQTLARLREAWKAKGHPDIVARIGINSGPLVVGNVGSQARMEYTVMGDSVNLASRLEGANKYYGTAVLLGPRTYELAKDDVEAREVDRLRVKGKREPVVVYELLGVKGALPPDRAKPLALYREGLTLYQCRDFEEAKRRFDAVLELDPGDGPSHVYRERTAAYLATPPPGDWDGVFELPSK